MASNYDPTLMDPLLLDPDELQYELALRMILADDPNRLARLKGVLEDERKGLAEVPPDASRISRQTVTQEIKECERKLSQIEQYVSEAMREANEELIDRGQARLVHITGRIVRLQAVAREHAAVNRLVERITSTAKNISRSRESIGSGEQAFEGFDDQESQIPLRPSLSYPHGLGAETGIQGANSNGTSSHTQQSTIGTTRADPIQPSLPTSHPLWPMPPTTNPTNGTSQWAANIATTNNGTRPRGSATLFGSTSNLFRTTEAATDYYLAPNVRNLFEDPAVIHTQPSSAQNGNRIPPTANPGPIGSIMPSYQPLSNMPPQRNVNNQVQAVGSQQPSPSGPHRQERFAFAGGHRIHQWSLRFDGGANGIDAEDFLFRVERQAQLYGVSERALAIGIGELLQGRAVQWYWNFQREHENASWEQLKAAFRRRYGFNQNTDFEIRARIEARKQSSGERFNDFCQDVESMALRLVHRMQQNELIEVLRRNMCMPLRKALWRERTNTVDELVRLCTEYEQFFMNEEPPPEPRPNRRVSELVQDEPQWHSHVHQNHHSQSEADAQWLEAIQTSTNRNELMVCWNCKDLGHTFAQCKRQRNSVFCYSCGMSGVLKSDCPKCSGNVRRGATTVGAARPQVQRNPQILQQPKLCDQNPFKPDTSTQ